MLQLEKRHWKRDRPWHIKALWSAFKAIVWELRSEKLDLEEKKKSLILLGYNIYIYIYIFLVTNC